MPLPQENREALDLVQDDVLAGFGSSFGNGAFTPVEPFEQDLLISSATTVAVPWRFEGEHQEPFAGVAATGRRVAITGVTFLREDERGELVFHRIVDWLDLYQNLGVVTASRAPILRDTPEV